ncbi:formimidoylglutamate deiminase [Microlunatus panaciterrae]|uniref:Formiminoglutamate deiminase n=1 Tax=Microlunatus panaciterrae TaxID=400768 RepID=A0ABS2RJ74_9ACTN|nr:formimidoylglutamate deiminase [Microlunatus panaciterrae]MBM7799041.1 formiminoglutamate deiminase [Microlunatus panaciterrae]
MSSFWAPLAQLPAGVATDVRLTIVDDRLSSVETGTEPRRGDHRLAGLVLPGLADAHSHVFHRALRGRTNRGGGSFWRWREEMYAVAARLDPHSYLALARAAYAEMTLAGYTAVGEFHYLHHGPDGRRYADPNAMGRALIQAAAEAGLRLTLLDSCYFAGGLTGSGHRPAEGVQRRFTDTDVSGWAERVSALQPTQLLRIGAAVHSVRAVPRESLEAVAAVARERPLHLHLSEQRAENEAALEFYGCSPTELVHRSGLLGPDCTAVHATQLSGSDVGLLGRSGTSVCFCPTTERDLADGIGPARRLLRSGSPLVLGSDQHSMVDPFEELRGLEMHERLVSNERGRFSPAQLIEAATAAGYRSLGWPEGGRIVAGALADFVVVRTDTVRTTGSAPEEIIFAATSADVDQVVVGGETVVRNGVHRLGPVAPLLRDALEMLRPG